MPASPISRSSLACPPARAQLILALACRIQPLRHDPGALRALEARGVLRPQQMKADAVAESPFQQLIDENGLRVPLMRRQAG